MGPQGRIFAWFDNFSLKNPDLRQLEGLRDSARFLHDLIKQEAELLGPGGLERVILGGLSQGCAMGFHALMSFEQETAERVGWAGSWE